MTNINPSEGPDKSSPKKRRYLSAEKKFQIYLEAQDGNKPVGDRKSCLMNLTGRNGPS